MTIDELIAIAAGAREVSPLGGRTVVCLCEYEREYEEITRATLDTGSDSAVFLVCVDD
jgi:hypothetical protein